MPPAPALFSTTMIQPVENNPLKFSANFEDAMQNLFLKRTQGWLGPAESFQDAFDDLIAHEMAMVAGIRAAFAATALHTGCTKTEAPPVAAPTVSVPLVIVTRYLTSLPSGSIRLGVIGYVPTGLPAVAAAAPP